MVICRASQRNAGLIGDHHTQAARMPPPEAPLINRETGTVDRVWYDYLKSLDVLVRILLTKVTYMAGFFDKLFGGGGTKEGADKGVAERNAALATGTQLATDNTTKGAGYYDKAQQWFDPSYDTANSGNQAYARAMGLGTPEEQQAEYAKFPLRPGRLGGEGCCGSACAARCAVRQPRVVDHRAGDQ